MIASVEGVLQSRGTTSVVLVGGLGLAVSLTERAATALPPEGGTVRLWTHLAVREDGWTLYGFTDPDELALFRLLISVSGVGPKLALGMLSGAPAPTIALALSTGDEKALTALPGIGKKSAARLVVELAQKVPASLLAAAPADAAAAPAVSEGSADLTVALDLLASMGLSGARAERVLRDALDVEPDLAADPVRWVRAALKRLS